MSEIRKTKINKGGKPYLGLLPSASGPASWPAQPAGGPARLPPLSSSSSTEGGECGRRARATAPRHLLACLPALPSSLDALDDATPLPLLPLTLPRFSIALSRSRPKHTVAAVRRSHCLRPPLAPPSSSEAPPQLPLPPHPSSSPRKPCIAATSPFPSSGSDHRRRRIRRLQRVPEPASTPTATAVSYATVSPSSPPRSLTVASFPPRPNLRRRRARRRRSSGDHLVTPASPTSSQDPVEHP